MRHHGEIESDIQTLESHWDTNEYFKAGEDFAEIATLSVGPIESELDLAEMIANCSLTTD